MSNIATHNMYFCLRFYGNVPSCCYLIPGTFLPKALEIANVDVCFPYENYL